MWPLPVQRGVTAGAQDEDRTGVGCGAGTQGGLGEPVPPLDAAGSLQRGGQPGLTL